MVKANIINEDGDLVMGLVEVPLEDKRPEVKLGTRIAPDHRDVQPGNPLKDADGPVV